MRTGPSTPCPTNAFLEKYILGELNAEESDDAEHHLAKCDSCNNRHRDLLSRTDPLHKKIRNLLLRSPDTLDRTKGHPTETHIDQLSPGALNRQAPGSTRTQFPRLDGYEIVSEIGHGGMGVVYEARDLRLDRRVAVKTILGKFQSEERLRLLRREAQLAARLRHQNIVAVHALIETSDPPCVIMEWVDGVPLDQALRYQSFTEIAQLTLKVARAVAYAHDRGVIHRDLKPGNILVDRGGEPRLLDFGLARAYQSQDEAATADVVKGTPLFMAPEQFVSPASVGPSADVFALGLLLYASLTRTPPPTPGAGASLADWARREVQLPRQANPDIPEALQRICLKACERQVGHRYASAEIFADDLDRFLRGQPVHARPLRYERLLEDRVQLHVDAIDQWEQERLISRREADLLQNDYVKLLRNESVWVPGARRLRMGTVLVQVGGWLTLLTAVLWVTVYWKKLSPLERTFAIGFPTVVINSAAFFLWRRPSQMVALIFSVVGSLLLPLFILACLSNFGWLSNRDQMDVLPKEFFTNRQLVLAFGVSSLVLAWVVSLRPFALLAATLCLILFLTNVSILCYFGMKDWIEFELYAGIAIAFSLHPVLSNSVARWLDQKGLGGLAIPFYFVAAVGLLAAIGTFAYDAPRSWLELEERGGSSRVNSLAVAREAMFFGCGVICFAIAWFHDKSSSRIRRQWGGWFFRLTPPLFVIPVELLSHEPMTILGKLGSESLKATELGVPALCITLIVLGTRLQLRWFTYYGLLHLAWSLGTAADRHFRNYLSWPIIIMLLGALLILAGLGIERGLARSRRPNSTTT